MPASGTDPRQSMLPTQKPKKVWQAGAAPTQAQAAEDWEEELDRELKFFTDGMEELQGSGGEGVELDDDDVQGLQGSLGPPAPSDIPAKGSTAKIVALKIPTEVTNFSAQQLKGMPNSKTTSELLNKMYSAAQSQFEEKKNELISSIAGTTVNLTQLQNDAGIVATELNDTIISTVIAKLKSEPDAKKKIRKEALEYKQLSFYVIAFEKLTNLRDALKPLYFDASSVSRTSDTVINYANCANVYFEFQTFFLGKETEINQLLAKDTTSYTELCTNLDMTQKLNDLQTKFDAEIKKALSSKTAAATGSGQPQTAQPDPSQAAAAAGSGQPQTAQPDPSAAVPGAGQPPPNPSAPQQASPDPIPPSGANKNGTNYSYFSHDFDFLPDLNLYLKFDENETIKPGSPDAVLHATKWLKFYSESLFRYDLDLSGYETSGKLDPDYEKRKKILAGNGFICYIFKEFWTVILHIQQTIEPFYENFKKTKFNDQSDEYTMYTDLYTASKPVLNFFLDIKQRVFTELKKPDPVLTKSSLFDDTEQQLLVKNYEIFTKQYAALSPKSPGPAGGSSQAPQAGPPTQPKPAASSVPGKPGVGGVDVSETVLFDPDFYFLPEMPFMMTGIETAPGSRDRIDNANKMLNFYHDINEKMKKLEAQVSSNTADQDYETKLNKVTNNFLISQIFQNFFKALLQFHKRIKPFYDQIKGQNFDSKTAEFAQYKKIIKIFNDVLNLFLVAERKVTEELKKPVPKIVNDNIFPNQSMTDYAALETKLIDLTKSAYPSQSSPPKQTSQQSSSSKSDKPSSSSRSNEPVTTFSGRSARPDPTDVAELRELLEKTREWGMQMRAAAQENYRIAQKVREFFGPGYEFGEPNKKAPDYDDPPYK